MSITRDIIFNRIKLYEAWLATLIPKFSTWEGTASMPCLPR